MAELDDPDRISLFDHHITALTADSVLNECVREAAELAEAPIALVSLILRKIQLFRAAYGLPDDLGLSRATSRCDSFCQFVVLTENAFIVVDAPKDSRVPQDLVVRYGIRAYAGVPIRYEGRVLGSLCVIDVKPRTFDADVIKKLEELSAKVTERLLALREFEDEPTQEEVDTAEITSTLAQVRRDGRVIERAVCELDSTLRTLEQADKTQLLSTGVIKKVMGLVRDVEALYNELNEQLRAVQRNALIAVKAIALQGKMVASEELAAFQRCVRGITQALEELGPVVRLLQGISEGKLSVSDFERNASVLREALSVDHDLRAMLRGVMEHGHRLEAELRGVEGEPYSSGGASEPKPWRAL